MQKILWIYLGLSQVLCYKYEAYQDLKRLWAKPSTIVGSSEGTYFLGGRSNQTFISKLSSNLESVDWSITLQGENAYYPVDLVLSKRELSLLVNVFYISYTEVPELSFVTNPKLKTWQPLLLRISEDGQVRSSEWVGNCKEADSLAYKLQVKDSTSYILSHQSCHPETTILEGRSSLVVEGTPLSMELTQEAGYLITNTSQTKLTKLDTYFSEVWQVTVSIGSFKDLVVTENYIVLLGSNTLVFLDEQGNTEWIFKETSVTFNSLSKDHYDGVLVSGVIKDQTKFGTANSQAGILYWFTESQMPKLRASRVYDQKNAVFIDSYSTQTEVYFLVSSSSTFYNSSNPNAEESSIIFKALEPFSLEKCFGNCQECFGTDSFSCYSCTTYFLEKYHCGDCHKSCDSCIGPLDSHCVECSTGHTWNNGRCQVNLNCSKGYFAGSESCEECGEFCAECLSLETCLLCKDNYYLNDGVCIPSCPSYRYFSQENQCLDCSAKCESCYGPQENQCTECRNTQLLYKGTCISECPLSTYVLDKECFDCSEECKQCDSYGKCLSCAEGYFEYEEECIQKCPFGFFKRADSCFPCSENCQECDSQKCFTCEKGYYLHQSECKVAPTCQETYFFNGTDCEACHSNCLSCFGKEHNECYECSFKYFLNNTECKSLLANCNSTSFRTQTNQCQPCSYPCLTCNSSTFCESCLGNLLSYKGACVTECPSKAYQTNSSCVDCSLGCELCNSTTCFSCQEELFINKYECVESCGPRKYPVGAECFACPENCNVCEEGICSECLEGFYLSEFGCEKCPCKACRDGETCYLCGEGLVLKDSKCLNECGTGYYEDSGVCKACSENCAVCNSTRCFSCKLDINTLGWFTLENNKCLDETKCAEGMQKELGKCQVKDWDLRWKLSLLEAALRVPSLF